LLIIVWLGRREPIQDFILNQFKPKIEVLKVTPYSNLSISELHEESSSSGRSERMVHQGLDQPSSTISMVSASSVTSSDFMMQCPFPPSLFKLSLEKQNIF